MTEAPLPPIGDIAALAIENATTLQRLLVEMIGTVYVLRATLIDLAASDPALIDRIRESLQADMSQHAPHIQGAVRSLLDSISDPSGLPAATLQ